MCFLLKMGIFHCYVSLPEGKVRMIKGPFWFNQSLFDGLSQFKKHRRGSKVSPVMKLCPEFMDRHINVTVAQ